MLEATLPILHRLAWSSSEFKRGSDMIITSSVYKMDRMHWNSTDCIKIQEQPNLNQTLCSYIKSFRLPNEYYVTVCRYGNRTLIDIRQFLNRSYENNTQSSFSLLFI
jgi:hypothetical protein